MFVYKSYVLLVFSNLILAKSLPQNETSVLTTYAKVANFGSSSSTVNEGRSSGMSLYTQSSHAKVIGGQNLKSKIPYYAFKPSRMSPVVMENFPARGEVQERFNPRPYFQYLHVPAKKLQTSGGSANPSPVYGAPFDSFPVFKGSDSSAGNVKPAVIVDARPSNGNAFSSTYDSYISPNAPIDSYSSPMNENDGKESDNSMMDSSQSKENDNSSPTGNSNEYPGYPYAPPDNMSSEDQKMPSSEESSSVEMSDTSSHENNHDYSHYHDVGPTIVNTVRPPGPIEMPYHDHGDSGGAMDSSGDMSNEEGGGMHMPKQMPNGYPKLPEYIDHDPKEHGFHYPAFYHYDHHPVYHEITTTTTTTEAPQEERVNNNYSYYYLGRKLWYIPLYFSAYFIIYITVLILKSIARHKVNFWHDLHNLGNRREGRNLKLEEMTKNVTDSIERAQARYMM